MSRTVKTTPKWVRINADPAHLAVEVHDHSNGSCDLDPSLPPLDPADSLWPRLGECGYEWSNLLAYGPGHGCGCPMCSEQAWRAAERRRGRYAARALCRRLAKALAAGEDPDDVE